MPGSVGSVDSNGTININIYPNETPRPDPNTSAVPSGVTSAINASNNSNLGSSGYTGAMYHFKPPYDSHPPLPLHPSLVNSPIGAFIFSPQNILDLNAKKGWVGGLPPGYKMPGTEPEPIPEPVKEEIPGVEDLVAKPAKEIADSNLKGLVEDMIEYGLDNLDEMLDKIKAHPEQYNIDVYSYNTETQSWIKDEVKHDEAWIDNQTIAKLLVAAATGTLPITVGMYVCNTAVEGLSEIEVFPPAADYGVVSYDCYDGTCVASRNMDYA